MADVRLVQMPYSGVNRPSIGLGLLAAYLDEAELECEVVYANLLFAEEVGLDVYRLVEETPPHDLLGEWTFAEAAFREADPDPAAYFRLAGRSFGGPHVDVLRSTHPDVDLRRLFRAVRRRAVGFVDRAARRVLADRPRIVGCSSMFQQQCASLALLRRVRELNPDVVTMIGGPNCEGPMGRATLELFPWVDYVASGEADGYVGAFCRRLVDEGRPAAGEPLPHGLFGRDAPRCTGADAVAATPPPPAAVRNASETASPPGGGEARGVVLDLDSTAVPVYDDYFRALDASALAPYIVPNLPLETSRGCWWGAKHHCTFCGLSDLGIGFRSKSAERVLEEMRHLAERHGVRRFETVDEILDMAYLRRLLPALAEEEEPYAIFYEVKSNLKRAQMELLARAGIRWVQPGIESLHDELLGLFDKGNNGLMNIQFLKWGAELGIRIGWNFLYGAPGESDEWYLEMADRLPLLHHLQPPLGSARIGYHRFSPYHDDPERFGIRLDPCDVYRHVFPVSDEELDDLAYYFDDYADDGRGDIDPTRPGRPRPGLAALRREVSRWRRTFFARTDEPPTLVVERRAEGELEVRDTRPLAVAGHHRLDALPAAVLDACASATTEAGALRRVRAALGAEVSPAAVGEALDELRRRRLVVADGERHLSLVLGERRALPPRSASPGGEIRILDYVRDHAGRSLAKECARPVDEVTVAELFSAR